SSTPNGACDQALRMSSYMVISVLPAALPAGACWCVAGQEGWRASWKRRRGRRPLTDRQGQPGPFTWRAACCSHPQCRPTVGLPEVPVQLLPVVVVLAGLRPTGMELTVRTSQNTAPTRKNATQARCELSHCATRN